MPDREKVRLAVTSHLKLFNKLYLYQRPTYGTGLTPRFIEMMLTDTAKRAELQKKVTAGILRDTFVVRCLKRGETIEKVLIKIGLSAATGEDAKEKYLKLSKGGI